VVVSFGFARCEAKTAMIWAKKIIKYLCNHEKEEFGVVRIFSRVYFMEFNLYRKDALDSL
jgi:hypothetical protein